MKSLVEYIKESQTDWLRFDIKDLKGTDNISSELSSLYNETGIYNEKIDNGFKIHLDTSKKENLSKYVEFIQKIVDANAEDESKKDKVEKLQSKIEKMNGIINTKEEKPEKDNKKDEEEKKEEE